MHVFIYPKQTNEIDFLTCTQSPVDGLLCSVKIDMTDMLINLKRFEQEQIFFF